MTTSQYPTNFDTFVDPQPGNKTNNPSHSGQHTLENDAIAALQQTVGKVGSYNFAPASVTGTVTSVSVATANGFAGTVATNTTTPAITVKTTVTGLLKGNGTAVSAATSGTDYAPGTGSAGTGLVVSTTGTGALTTVAAPSGTVVGTSDSQTLTNKTLTAPVIATITNTGTITLPTSTDTLVGRATTDTLTNKRVSKRVYSASAPGATPLSAVSTDSYDEVHLTGLAANITSMNPAASSPLEGDTLLVSLTDNNTARTITWGSSFEGQLPTTTVAGVRMDVSFRYNGDTGKWHPAVSTAVTQTDIGSQTAVTTSSTTMMSISLTPGTWEVDADMLVTGNGSATSGDTATFQAAVFSGVATIRVTSPGGGVPGTKVSVTTSGAGTNFKMPVHFKFIVDVTSTGSIGVSGIASAAHFNVSYQDASFGGNTQVSYLTARLLG